MGERRHAVAVGDVDIGAGFGEEPDDLGMSRAAVAEDHRLEQRGPAQVVDVILVDRGSEQDLHRLDVAVMRRRDEAGAAIAVGVLEVGAGGERHLQDFDAALSGGVEIGRILDEILGVDVGALLNEVSRDLDAVAVGRGQERGASALVAGVDASAAGEKLLHHDKLAALRRGDHLALGLVGLLSMQETAPRDAKRKRRPKPPLPFAKPA